MPSEAEVQAAADYVEDWLRQAPPNAGYSRAVRVVLDALKDAQTVGTLIERLTRGGDLRVNYYASNGFWQVLRPETPHGSWENRVLRNALANLSAEEEEHLAAQPDGEGERG